jgi:hypothetical protein
MLINNADMKLNLGVIRGSNVSSQAYFVEKDVKGKISHISLNPLGACRVLRRLEEGYTSRSKKLVT